MASLEEIYDIYSKDRLVVCTFTPAMLQRRYEQMQPDAGNLHCGSLLFYHGVTHQPTQRCLPNAVARFGDDFDQVFLATMHDLDRVWCTHERLEHKRQGSAEKFEQVANNEKHPAFVYFSNCDMCPVANIVHGGEPGATYLECEYGTTPPVKFQRCKGFDFRRYCEESTDKEDTGKNKIHAEWNELRACLSTENLVGLVYVWDPFLDPYTHVDHVHDLQKLFGQHYNVCIFQLSGPREVTGDLMVDDMARKAVRLVDVVDTKENASRHDLEKT